MVIFKHAHQSTLHDSMTNALKFIEHIFEEYGETCIVNSGRRTFKENKDAGGHQNSKHLHGKAIDVSTSILKDIDEHRIYAQIKTNLQTQGYDVVQYATHIHIEYDPK